VESKYSIKDLERISGIKAHTLRIWEQRYDLLQPSRTETNIRYYTNADLKRIINVSFLNNNGYKISSIAKLDDNKLIKEVENFFNSYRKESDQIESLVLSMIDVNEQQFENTINKSIKHFGFQNTMENIVFPFFKQLGDMWQVGIISAAQEHYISNLIRQKLIVGIDNVPTTTNESAKRYLFFLPEGELHEIGLLYTYFLTKSKGHRCYYLGQSVPFDDVKSIAESIVADFLVCIFTANPPNFNIETYLNACNLNIINATFLVSGRLLVASEAEVKIPDSRFKVYKDFVDFKNYI
jgi:MerR family transcriptional regulator, light-induced transcriptional regulator